ncbi:MAG TPA: LPS-assembly protein LptD [Firmicutes bacterium]|nr:LPS-assembly protein LptD [Bacillota bacterium]
MRTWRNLIKRAAALLALLALLGGAAWAKDPRVHVVVGEKGTYNFDTHIFRGEGGIEITYDDLYIAGDYLVWNVDSGDLKVTGSVLFDQDELQMTGDALYYNLNSGKGTFDRAEAELILSEKTGTVFVSGEEIALESEQFYIRGAHLTTCDLPVSHYHVATKEIEVIPDEKAIIRGVTYYEGKIPIFYWPYLVIPLDTQERDTRFSLPVVGFGEEEGYYLKNTFNYYSNPKAYGHLYFDIFTRLGLGVGARHFYDLNTLGLGSLYLYHIPSSQLELWKAAWDHEVEKDSWQLKTDSAYENSLKKKLVNSETRLALSQPKFAAEAWLVYKDDESAAVKRLFEYGGKWEQRLSDNWRLNLVGKLTEQKKAREDLRLVDYLAETTYSRGRHNLSLAVEQKYNPELLKTAGQAWRHIQRLPELGWEVSDLALGDLRLKSKLLLGRYRENPQGTTGSRLRGQINLPSRTWRPWDSLSLSYQGEAVGAVYAEQKKHGSLYGRVAATQRLTDHLQLTSTYSQRVAWGSSPFRFDLQKPLQDLSLRANYRKNTWQASLSGSYDFKAEKYSALLFRTSWRPNANWSLDLSTSHNLPDFKIERAVPIIEYMAGDTKIQLAGRYRFDRSRWERLDTKLSLPVGETWQVSYEGIYEPARKRFKAGQFSVSKDLHCRTISFAYEHVEQRVAFQYTIKAFPTLPIGWDSVEGISLFDFEEISDIIGLEE